MLVTASQEAGVLEETRGADAPPGLRLRGPDGRPGDGAAHRTRRRAGRAVRRGAARGHRRGGYASFPSIATISTTSIGILHAIDVVKAIADGRRDVSAAADRARALTVPETMAADDLLAAIRHRGVREAIVIDEYGGTAGLVTFEWLMERIVGNRRGGRGQDDCSPGRIGRYRRADARHRRQRAVRLHIDEDTYTTLGGYVMGRIGRRARIGDTIEVRRTAHARHRSRRAARLAGVDLERKTRSSPAAARDRSTGRRNSGQ